MVALMSTAQRRATEEDRLKVPDLLVAEICGGELITSPRPSFPHARAALSLGQDLRLEGQHWVVASSYGGAESVRTEPFEAIELDMGRWWLEEA